jgi:hypothetical protein
MRATTGATLPNGQVTATLTATPSHLPVLLHVTTINDRQIDQPGMTPAQH